jgi:hypothetical protein
MTVKPPNSSIPQPEDFAHGKKEAESDLENKTELKKSKKDPNEGLIETGPFKGLPVPLQKKDHESLMPYISCNEKEQAATLAALATSPSNIAPEKKVHIGFAVWFNLDIMALTKPAYGILCDYDNKVMDVYQGINESLQKSGSRREFVTNFEMFLNQNSEQLFSLPPAEIIKLFNIQQELTRPGSWLASEESFQSIKKLSESGRLLFLNVNILDKEAFLGFKTWLDTNHLELDTLYTSNIIDWLQDGLQRQAYLLNLQTISTPNTRFVEAISIIPTRSKKPQPKQEPIQHTYQGIKVKELFPAPAPETKERFPFPE